MPRVQVTRNLHFSASHRLYRKEWSDEENARFFGLCSNPAGHGHNYEIDVTVEGPVDADTGYVIDLKVLKDLVNETVVNDLDHRNLNVDVPWLEGMIPSTENLVVAIWDRLVPVLPEGVELKRIVLAETPRNRVEYSGD